MTATSSGGGPEETDSNNKHQADPRGLACCGAPDLAVGGGEGRGRRRIRAAAHRISRSVCPHRGWCHHRRRRACSRTTEVHHRRRRCSCRTPGLPISRLSLGSEKMASLARQARGREICIGIKKCYISRLRYLTYFHGSHVHFHSIRTNLTSVQCCFLGLLSCAFFYIIERVGDNNCI